MSSTAEQLDATRALVDGWRAGDEAARDLLLQRLYPIMRRWARALVGDSDEADDVAQEAVIVVYAKIEQFRGDASFSGWLYRITARVAGQRRRRFVRRVALVRAAPLTDSAIVYTTDPGGRVDAGRLAAQVEQLYDTLPAAQRAAMGLVDLDGYTPAQAAEMMDVAPGTLRVNLFKARASVRRRLLASVPELADRLAAHHDS
ncbi:MAG: RNA polymerase sigma factor [Gemmatimonadota bacterium]